MNMHFKFIGIFIVISLIFCITATVSAAEISVDQPSGYDINTMDIMNDTDLREEVLSNLESNGVNTSVLKAAISVGASGKVKNILEYYKDKLQANPDYVKPEVKENESEVETGESQTISEESIPVPTETKSPLSPLIAFVGIGVAGCIAVFLRR